MTPEQVALIHKAEASLQAAELLAEQRLYSSQAMVQLDRAKQFVAPTQQRFDTLLLE